MVKNLTFNDERHEWSHGNSIAPLPDDRVLVSFRNISTVAIIGKASGEIEWQLGPEVLAAPQYRGTLGGQPLS